MQLGWFTAAVVVLLGPVQVLAGNVLKTDGYSLCFPNATIEVNNFSVEYDQSSNNVLFDVSGASDKVQNVTISLVVYAYGNQVYQKDFNPCSSDSFVQELCPVPARSFSASGNTTIPSQYAGMIPSIAFNVPNLDGQARLELKAADTGEEVACIESQVTNGKTLQVPAISYVTAAVAAASLALSGVTALATAGHPGATASSPSFGEVIGWFQTVATSGMLSVQYPPVYRAFTSNFAFSTGIIPWKDMQNSIDNFRNMTGGNLTANSYEFLRNSNSSLSNGSSLAKRVFSNILDRTALFVRDVSTSTNATTNSTSSTGLVAKVNDFKTWFQQLYIPSSNVFMTVLLFFAIVVAAIAVGILLVKVILETWALYGSFPQGLVEFRKHYWGLLGRTITNLILMLYGIWVLYCIYQFTRGDSWAAKLLAGLTLAAFTAVLAAFAARIWILARRFRKSQGDTSVLYEDREVWRRYSLFYDSYKQSYWWIFIPAIIYSFAKGCIIAGGDGHGLVQTGGQLIVESLMLILLLWSRPYVAKSGQWINITIQVVRVLSVVCILVFVEELGIAQTTKTVTGVVLIAVQSTLTVVLAILIGVNGLIACIKQNPHDRLRERRGKEDPDADNLTALDARNSLLFDRHSRADIYEESKYSMLGPHEPYRDVPTKQGHVRERSTDGLINNDSYYRGHAREQSGPFRMMDRNRSPSPEELQLREQRPRDFGMAF